MGCISKADGGTTTKTVDPRNPEEKPYEWFISDVGQEVYKEYMVIQNFQNDDLYEKEQKEKDIEYFSVYIHVYRKEHKSPRIFFESLATALGKVAGCSDALEYVRPIEETAVILKLMAKPCYFDDNGDPIPVDPAPDGAKLCNADINPVLKFVRDFHVFNFGGDLDWKAMGTLWHDALFFVVSELLLKNDWQVLDKNPWLFDKSSYLTDMGTLRTEKGFLTTGVEKSTNPDYFKKEIANL